MADPKQCQIYKKAGEQYGLNRLTHRSEAARMAVLVYWVDSNESPRQRLKLSKMGWEESTKVEPRLKTAQLTFAIYTWRRLPQPSLGIELKNDYSSQLAKSWDWASNGSFPFSIFCARFRGLMQQSSNWGEKLLRWIFLLKLVENQAFVRLQSRLLTDTHPHTGLGLD